MALKMKRRSRISLFTLAGAEFNHNPTTIYILNHRNVKRNVKNSSFHSLNSFFDWILHFTDLSPTLHHRLYSSQEQRTKLTVKCTKKIHKFQFLVVLYFLHSLCVWKSSSFSISLRKYQRDTKQPWWAISRWSRGRKTRMRVKLAQIRALSFNFVSDDDSNNFSSVRQLMPQAKIRSFQESSWVDRSRGLITIHIMNCVIKWRTLFSSSWRQDTIYVMDVVVGRFKFIQKFNSMNFMIRSF